MNNHVTQPVHLSCVGPTPSTSCTDEEFGGYFVDVQAAMKLVNKHPHPCQILPVSIEEYREATNAKRS